MYVPLCLFSKVLVVLIVLAMVLVMVMAVGVVTVVMAPLKFKVASENYTRLPLNIQHCTVVV